MCEKEKEGLLEGMARGLLKGKSDAQIENAKKMIASGKLSLEDIAFYSGLPLAKIKELAD